MTKVSMHQGAQLKTEEPLLQDNDGLDDAPFGDLPNVPRELKNRMHLLEDQVAELYEFVADDATRSATVIEKSIVERPWLSVALAFGLGCATAALLRPSRG
jgi:ElaB/YqjD/DUF883 family membrane-anchored ribosome-binding protein